MTFSFSFFFPSARAEAYKEDGNYEYKRKKFKEAIAAYTDGIKIKCNDAGLNAILYTNRATAHFCLGISQRNSVWMDIFSSYLVLITYGAWRTWKHARWSQRLSDSLFSSQTL